MLKILSEIIFLIILNTGIWGIMVRHRLDFYFREEIGFGYTTIEVYKKAFKWFHDNGMEGRILETEWHELDGEWKKIHFFNIKLPYIGRNRVIRKFNKHMWKN